MRRVCLGLVFMFALAGVARPASATAITFNEAGLVPGLIGSGTSVGSQLASLGVKFGISGGVGAAYISSDAFLGPAGSASMSQNYLVVNTLPFNSASSWATLSAWFVDPTSGEQATASSFSVTVSDSNADPARMQVKAFAVDGSELESYTLTTFANTFAFNSTNIARIDFIDTGGDGHIIDNFNFTLNRPPSTTVPEPASMALLATGGAVLACVRRRRTKQ